MASWITLTGVKPYDGRYLLDLDGAPLTMREWGWIKRHTGYLPATLTSETFTDPELITMLALISMSRAGTITQTGVTELWDRLSDEPFGTTITLDTDPDTEDDAGPPPNAKSEKPSSSGASSPTGSVSSAAPPKGTGSPRSATSESAPAISVR